MSDESLRALERAARESPDDRVAGWAFAQALDRLGDHRRHWLELARLARRGDAVAARALDAWVARPRACGAAVAGRCRGRGLRAAGVVRERAIDLSAPLVVAAATSEGVLVAGASVGWIERESLGVAWRGTSTSPAPALRGEDVIVAEGASLALRDRTTGRELARAALPAPAEDLEVDGDRALVRLEEPGRSRLAAREQPLLALDVGEDYGRQLWSRTGPPLFTTAGQRVFLLHFDESVEALALDSGDRLWRSERPFAAHWPRCTIVADEHLVVLENFEGLTAFDAATGERRWSRGGRLDVAKLALSQDAIVVLNVTQRGLGLPASDIWLAALDRDGGEERWRVRLELDRLAELEVAVSRDTVTVGVARAGSEVIDLVAFDVVEGMRLFELSLDTGAVPRSLSLASVRGDLIVVAGSGDRAWAARVEAAP